MKYLVVIIIIVLGLSGLLLLKNSKTPVLLAPTPGPTIISTNPNDPNDMVILESPIEDQVITSPLIVRGKARGNWFFEASFPLVLTDWDGKIIAESFAQASGDWMTTDYVPFEGKIEFKKPEYGQKGTLILQKDNPSGLPKNAAAYEITVYFD